MHWEHFTGWLRKRLAPVEFGIAETLGFTALMALAFTYVFASIPSPSPEFFRGLADLGIALLIGYVLEATWLAKRGADGDWIGALTGFAIAGLLAAFLALLIAEHRAAGHDNLLDDLGLAWIIPSYLLLGGIVVAFPWLVWMRNEREDED